MSTIYRDAGFVHLHTHSAFSLLEGALPIAVLAKLAEADGMAALALTDTNNLFGALEFSEKTAEKGIQPIIGLQLNVDFGDHQATPGRPTAHREGRGKVVLLATSEAGYRNLMRLSSAGFMETESTDEPHVAMARVASLADGVIALTGGPDGPIDRAIGAGRQDIAERRLLALAEAFPERLYVELQRHGLPGERSVEPRLLALAYAPWPAHRGRQRTLLRHAAGS